MIKPKCTALLRHASDNKKTRDASVSQWASLGARLLDHTSHGVKSTLSRSSFGALHDATEPVTLTIHCPAKRRLLNRVAGYCTMWAWRGGPS